MKQRTATTITTVAAKTHEEKSGGVIPHRLWRLVENIHDLWQQYCVSA